MYCPSCGNSTSTSQKFCRSCGLGLEKIANSFAEQTTTKIDASLEKRRERLERMGLGALGVFGVGLVIPILYSIIYKTMILNGRIWYGIGLLGLLAVMACGVASAILFAQANELKEVGRKRRFEQTEDVSEAEATAKLLSTGDIEPIPSVTDRTTEHLKVKRER